MAQDKRGESGKLGAPGRRNKFWIAVIAVSVSVIWLLYFGIIAVTETGPARGASIAMVVLGLCYLAGCGVFVRKVVMARPSSER